MVAPALGRYETETLGNLWERAELSARDRSLVTIAALIQLLDTIELGVHIERALDNGVTASEIAETITQLSFYSGWPNGSSAVAVAHSVFSARGIKPEQLPPATMSLSPLDETVEAKRAAAVEELVGPSFARLADYTTHTLFRDLWLRPALLPRDRSLVAMAALVTAGHAAQIVFHVNKAMDNGMTREQVAEVITHLAFYSGWPNAMNAARVAKDVFESRPDTPRPS